MDCRQPTVVMQILMLADWLPPDFGAVGQYAMRFARELAVAGHRVTLVGLTSSDSGVVRTSPGAGLLTIRRVARPNYDKQSFVGRAWWTLKTNLMLLWHSRREFRQADEIRFTGSPPYMIHFVMPLAMLLGRRTRYRITDFHPECLMADCERVPRWLSVLHALTWWWRRRVNVMEVLGEDQRRLCLDGGIHPGRIELVRDPSPVRITGRETRATPPAALFGRKIVLYSGNWGVAHDHCTFVTGMSGFEARHPGYAGVWLNATGSRVDLVHQRLLSSAVATAHTPPVPLAELAGVLLAADMHVICLRDSFVGYALPSKVYACIELTRPILFIGSERSDVHLLCAEAASRGRLHYRRVAVDDAGGVIRSVEELLGSGSSSYAQPARLIG